MADNNVPQSLVKHKDLTAEFVRSILDYDPETGLFTWKWRSDAPPHWNAQWANRPTAKNPKARYHRIKINGRQYAAHHLAWLWMKGEWAPDEVDHRDRDKMNNRWLNLRESTRAQNRHNSPQNRQNKSGHTGVQFYDDTPRTKPWRAVIYHLGEKIDLGFFMTAEEAGAAYHSKQKALRGDFLHD